MYLDNIYVYYFKADDRSVAKRMISDYDAALADPSRVNRIHRVSHFLLGQDGENLGEDFKTFARGGAMSERLRTEITAYQACMLDDSAVEGPHASVSRISKSAASVGAAWWSSTLRFIQNQSCMKVCNEEEADIFNSLFLNWKVLSQRSPLRYRKTFNRDRRLEDFSILSIELETTIFAILSFQKNCILLQIQRQEFLYRSQIRERFNMTTSDASCEKDLFIHLMFLTQLVRTASWTHRI